MKLMTRASVPLLAVGLATGCGPGISESRMVQAPARESNCALELVTVDITSMAFNQTWETLGFVTLSDTGVLDPTAEKNRALVRPRACAMGGTSITVAINATNTNQMGQQGSSLMYMVLRPKSATPPPPAAF